MYSQGVRVYLCVFMVRVQMHVKHVVWDRVYMFMQRGLSNRKHRYRLIEGIDINIMCMHWSWMKLVLYIHNV